MFVNQKQKLQMVCSRKIYKKKYIYRFRLLEDIQKMHQGDWEIQPTGKVPKSKSILAFLFFMIKL